MNAKILAVILIFVTNFKICQSKSYQNYTLLKLVPQNSEDMKFLFNLEAKKYMDIMFWERPYKVNREVHLIINPVDFEQFKERAGHFKLSFEVLSENIENEFKKQILGGYNSLHLDSFLQNRYHTYDNIIRWMQDLAKDNNQFVRLEVIGKSAEGKDIYAISINKNRAVDKVIVDGGIHGHEWVSVAFVTYLINELIQYSSDTVFRMLVNSYHWLLIPVANPDGYEYTYTTDRLWRKNRRNTGTAIGVDLNRNFDHAFGKFASSRDPNDDIFCGEAPFSEPETMALSHFIENNKHKLKYYFSFHSYGQKIIIPYEDRIQHIENFSEMENYARQAILKIYRTNGLKYRTGTIYDTTGTRESGTSTSWAKKNFRIPYVYAFYLRDNGTYGFALPSDQIIPTCKETMIALIELMTARPRYIKSLFDNLAPPFCASAIVVLSGVFIAFQ